MGKRKQTHEFSDQYGEHKSQDREEHMGFTKGSGGGGGGTAGKSRARDTSLSFQRHVPKFLQAYSHMLGVARPADEDEPTLVADAAAARTAAALVDDDDDDRAAEEEAIQRALEENPELAEQLGPEYANKLEALREKEAGNRAFGSKDYEAAVTHFSRCIELDPKDGVFFSNRSAALAALGRHDDALADARRVCVLRPGWVKGPARKAGALAGLQRWGEAREAYEAALKLEPDDQSLRRGLEKAAAMELQHMRERKHVFKKARPSGGGSAGSGGQQQQQQQREGGSGGSRERSGGVAVAAAAAAASGAKAARRGGAAKLSFAADEEEEEEQ